MPDNIYNILIKYGLDDAKAKQAQAELDQLTQTVKDAAPATEKLADETDKLTLKQGDLKNRFSNVSGEEAIWQTLRI